MGEIRLRPDAGNSEGIDVYRGGKREGDHRLYRRLLERGFILCLSFPHPFCCTFSTIAVINLDIQLSLM